MMNPISYKASKAYPEQTFVKIIQSFALSINIVVTRGGTRGYFSTFKHEFDKGL